MSAKKILCFFIVATFIPSLLHAQSAWVHSSLAEKRISTGQSLLLSAGDVFAGDSQFSSVLPTDKSICGGIVLTDGSRKFVKLTGLKEGVTDVTLIPQNTDETGTASMSLSRPVTLVPRETDEGTGVAPSSPARPVTLKIMVVPPEDKYLALQEKIVKEFGVDIFGRSRLALSITPIPNSKKVLISGTVRHSQLIDDIRSLVIGKEITADSVTTRFVIDPCLGISK